MPNIKAILGGLSKAVEPVQETRAVGNAAIQDMLRMLDQKRLGVWDGKEPYDVWKARREAEIAQTQKYADGGQAFPLQDQFEAELERRRSRPRTRAGVPVEDTNVLGGALQGLGETLLGAGRGSLAATLGAPADILNLLNVKQFNTPDIPFGMEYFKEKLPFAPTTQTGQTAEKLGEFLPIDPREPVMAAVSGAKKAGKALAPTAAEMLEAQLKPYQMAIAPEGKAGKVKAPANEIGFYNPAEKAALNLQRKKGTGDAFIADLKKQPGVNDERIAELGLDQLKGKPNVTKEEIVALTEQNRIPLRESVKRERDESAIDELERRYDELIDLHSEASVTGNARAREEYEREMADNFAEQKRLKSIGEAKFSPADYPDYNMPGGTNYREIRVGLPVKRLTEEEARAVLGATPDAKLSPADIEYATNKAADAFEHPAHHGKEQNVLFHLRVADHTDAEGKTGLLIDELQSDWHQQGREKGYKGEAEREAEKVFKEYSKELGEKYDINPEQNIAMFARIKNIPAEEVEKYDSLWANWINSKGGVPDAPFKDNWYQLGLKRAIKEAADTGVDRVYLTTGARQADRYDLSKQIDAIKFNKMPDGKVFWTAEKDGQRMTGGDNAPNELDSIVGKEVAKKIREKLDEGPGEVSGLDLKIGGEGMRQYYDKNYRNYLEKYAKQFGSKLGETDLLTPARTSYGERTATEAVSSHPEYMDFLRKELGTDDVLSVPEDDFWKAYDKFETYLFGKPKGEKVYYIDITPEMRESAKKGQSYAQGGAVSFANGGIVDGNVWKQLIGAQYNTTPDISDSSQIIHGPALADGGNVTNAWKKLLEGARNA